MMPETANPLEMIWTVVIGFGLVTSLASLAWAHARYRELRGENGLLRVLRGGAVADLAKISVALLCLELIGMVALLTPPPQRALTPGSVLIAGVFLVLGVFLVWLVVSIRLRPYMLREKAKKE